MILYITDEAHKDYLSFITDEDVQVRIYRERDMLVKVRKELPYLSNVNAVIVDGTGIDKTTWPDAVELLHSMVQVPVLLIEESGQKETWISCGGYVWMNRMHKDIKEEILYWLQNGGDMNSPHTWIGVAGLSPSAGTTSLSMHLAQYIHLAGEQAAVTETGDSFPAMAEAYGWDVMEENVWNWGGVYYNSKQIDENIRYTVFDLGVMEKKKQAMLDRCEIKILVAEGKLHKLQALNQKLKELRNLSGTLILAFTFTPETDKAWLRKRYGSDRVSVWFAPVEVDLFQTGLDYGELVKDYIVPPVADKKKQTSGKREKGSVMKTIKEGCLQIPKKVWLSAAGVVVMLLFLFGMGVVLLTGKKEGQEPQEVVISTDAADIPAEAEDIRKESDKIHMDTETTEDAPEEGTIESSASQTETTEATVSTDAADIQGTTEAELQQNTEQQNIQTPVPEKPEGQAPAAEAPGQPISVQITPSLRGYQGQIYTGSQVVFIMNKFAGQKVAMHLITRTSEGWYNYSLSGNGLAAASAVSSGTALVDQQCSFLCQVIAANGEDVGLEFIQQ